MKTYRQQAPAPSVRSSQSTSDSSAASPVYDEDNSMVLEEMSRGGEGVADSASNLFSDVIEWGGDLWSSLFGGESKRGYVAGDVCVSDPFFDGATRGGFVWAIADALPDLGIGRFDRESVLAKAEAKGIFSGEWDRPINRAEAAQIISNALGFANDLAEGGVAYFYDVLTDDWYFNAAHAARVHGVFYGGNKDNLFRPGDTLTLDEARVVISRCNGAKDRILEPGDQVGEGMSPELEPNPALGLLVTEGELTLEDIALVRSVIASLPEDRRAEWYERLASKVTYRNQRDNAGTYYSPDSSCNMTSIAMALQGLGLGAEDAASMQFEDAIDKTRYDLTMGDPTLESTQVDIAGHYGAEVERVWTGSFAGGEAAKAWYQQTVTPRLAQGETATLSVITPDTPSGHIVRLQWVEDGGLLVDDPFGTLAESGRYDLNSRTSSEDQGAKGEDNLWTWKQVARFNSGRYVQFYRNTSVV